MFVDLAERLPLGGSLAPDLLAGTRLGSADLSTEERAALQAAIGPRRPVRAHAELLGEGDACDRMVMVVEGWACRYITARNGARQIVGLLVPGDIANLDVLAFDRPDYGVRMLSAGAFAAVPRVELRSLADKHPGVCRALARLTLIESANLRRMAMCLGRMSARQRVAHLFCELAVRLGHDGPASLSYALPLTQEEIADVAGLTAVHVNRTLRQLRDEGLVAWRRGTVALLDVPTLRRAAEFDPAYLHIDAAPVGPRAFRRGEMGAAVTASAAW